MTTLTETPTTVPAGVTTLRAHQLVINDRIAFVEDWGDGDATPLLALHTAGQSGVQYSHVAADLAALGYRVIVPDFPGHGRSEPSVDGPVTDLGDYAQFALTVLDQLGIDRFVVVGCSIGGKITIDLAVRAGDRIQAAIAMAAGADSGNVSIRGLTRELVDISTPSRGDRTYWGTRAVVGSAVTEERRSLIAAMHCREDPIVSNSDLIGWGRHDVRAGLPDIACPTILVAGEDDLWIDAEAIRRDAESIPRGSFTFLPGIGHYPMEEMTDFANQVDAWVRDLGQTDEGTETVRS
ncbi:alpha/beta fold hydrolase [Brevibacterium marinum]|uniref:Pimeloyl-ACP methyl ester carboxylesterase n=1 Tax=Brevibacterium marinum TaxID=418643 RepID=A0A846S4A3_9MICO|nr:alpha/beta hydrolase [Brevibacterium marinum]NJC58585.1 pimeloyl-ACP methyl ester carboxylesterase [Brevibacterium marinum]